MTKFNIYLLNINLLFGFAGSINICVEKKTIGIKIGKILDNVSW
jgi:hypothetical protein